MTLKSKITYGLLFLLTAVGLLEIKARADYDVTQGTGTTIFAFTCFTTKVCPAHVMINAAGTEIGTDMLTALQSIDTKAGSALTTQAASVSIGAVGLAANVTNACTLGKALSAASNNATNVKSSAGVLCSLNLFNTTTTVYYLKLYNTSSAPTCASDTVLHTIPIPPASAAGEIGGVVPNLSVYAGAFSTGISYCLVANFADNDNTSAATGVLINYSYK